MTIRHTDSFKKKLALFTSSLDGLFDIALEHLKSSNLITKEDQDFHKTRDVVLKKLARREKSSAPPTPTPASTPTATSIPPSAASQVSTDEYRPKRASDGIIASCFDTTSSNTGIYGGGTVLLPPAAPLLMPFFISWMNASFLRTRNISPEGTTRNSWSSQRFVLVERRRGRGTTPTSSPNLVQTAMQGGWLSASTS